MSDKKPQAGEWWEHEGYRVFVVGHRRDGVVITEAIGGFIGCIENEFGWKHLPDCDSFEWQPETFPQYWTTIDSPSTNIAYVIRHGVGWDDWSTVDESGNVVLMSGCNWYGDGRKQLTQSEAEARVKTPKPNYVRLWTRRTSGTVCTATGERYLAYPEIWTEIKHDGTGFYLAAD